VFNEFSTPFMVTIIVSASDQQHLGEQKHSESDQETSSRVHFSCLLFIKVPYDSLTENILEPI